MRRAMEQIGLETYSDALISEGYDDLPFLCSKHVSERALREIGAAVGMKPGHAMKFGAMLKRLRP